MNKGLMGGFSPRRTNPVRIVPEEHFLQILLDHFLCADMLGAFQWPKWRILMGVVKKPAWWKACIVIVAAIALTAIFIWGHRISEAIRLPRIDVVLFLIYLVIAAFVVTCVVHIFIILIDLLRRGGRQ